MYRCSKLNITVGGSKTSQHLYGQATDIKCTDTKAQLFNVIKKMITKEEIKVGQLIWEYRTKNQIGFMYLFLIRK